MKKEMLGILCNPTIIGLLGASAGLTIASMVVSKVLDTQLKQTLFDRMFDDRIAEMVEKGVILDVRPK